MTSETRIRSVVSWVLTIGVAISAGLLIIGFIGSFVVGWRGSLVGQAHIDESITDFDRLVSGLLALRPVAIAQLGLVVLISTPIVRVATSLVGFALERDRLYVAITAIVLVILLASAIVIR